MDKQITPIDRAQEIQVEQETWRFIQLAESFTGKKLPLLPIHFDLKGRTAGMYRLRGRQRIIRYNPFLFAKYFNENLSTTVPHEVAHYVVEQLYGLRRIRPHGKEWRNIMLAFGANASVTCNFDMKGIPTRQQLRHNYNCGCQQHLLSTVRHNKITRGTMRYFCKRCGDTLTQSTEQP